MNQISDSVMRQNESDRDRLSDKLFLYNLTRSQVKPMGVRTNKAQGNNYVQSLSNQQLKVQNELRNQLKDSYRSDDYDQMRGNRIMGATRVTQRSMNKIPQIFAK